jgi:hypothetical protein
MILSPFNANHIHAHKKHNIYNVTIICGIDCLACQDEFFVKNPSDVKENDEHALDYALHLSHLFFVLGDVGLFHWEDCCFVSGS